VLDNSVSHVTSPGTKMVNLAACIVTVVVFAHVLIERPAQQKAEEEAQVQEVVPETNPEVDETLKMLEESRTARQRGENQKAADILVKLLEKDPDNYLYLSDLIEAYHALRRYRDEGETWERYMFVAPTPDHGCPDIAVAWQRAGNGRKAFSWYQKCYEMAPNADNIFNLARQYEKAGRYDQAARYYEEGLKDSPGYEDMALGLGRAYMRTDRSAEAQKIAEQVLKEKPDYADALLLMGTAARRNGDNAAARKALEHGVKVAPNYADIRYMLGLVLESEGDNEGAADQYRKALQKHPDRDDIRNRLNRLGGGA